MTRRQFNAVLASTLLALSACEIPRFEGPQIQAPPVGFRLQPESAEQARLFPDRDLTFHSTWVHTDMSGVSLIHVNGHPGALTIEDVIAGFDAVRSLRQDPDLAYGEIEALRIDGRDGWGWAERIQSPSRGLVEVSYRAVIPYDTVTYAIEFFSGEPMWKQYAPDTLKAVIGTFAVGETTLNVPLIAMVVGAVLLLVSVLRARANERKTRLRSINLVQFKKPDEDEAGGDTSASPAEASPAEPVGAGAVARPAAAATSGQPSVSPPATPPTATSPPPLPPPRTPQDSP